MSDHVPDKLRKLARFATIYGPRRTAVKAMGRLRVAAPALGQDASLPAVGVIGCGQFAWATISYFLRGHARVVACFDVDTHAAETLASAWPGCRVVASAAELMADPAIGLVSIASNHASHADYAIAALAAGKDVAVEKPIAVSRDQLRRLVEARRVGRGRIFAGYNRPFSAAVSDLKASVGTPTGPLTLSCFISGHVLAEDHWYRRPEEGTRICGNVGHWLDLAVHLLGWRGALPDRWRIVMGWSNPEQRDDDVAITLMSDAGDLVNIVLTARTEPFEGINETINVQWGDTIAKIDDFRRQTIWRGSSLREHRYWPKDVGHQRAILQPFATPTATPARAWSEVEDSTLLMLHIMEMVQTSTPVSTFSCAQARAGLTTTPVHSTASESERP